MSQPDPLAAELAPVRERLAKASPGPWKFEREHLHDMDDAPFTIDAIVGPDGTMTGETMADMQFIAHARTDVSRLLEIVDATAARWQTLKDHLGTRIDQDLAVAESFKGTETSAAHHALVSANRSALAKMRELEAGRG